MSPFKPTGPCSYPGCPGRATDRGRCATHAAMLRREQQQRHDAARPSARARGYGPAWQALRAAVLADEPRCRVCGQPASDVHHIVAKRDGGTDDRSNLAPLCHAHHAQVTARERRMWRERAERGG